MTTAEIVHAAEVEILARSATPESIKAAVEVAELTGDDEAIRRVKFMAGEKLTMWANG